MQLLRAGSFPEVAAQAAGIDPATYYRWMRAGREEIETAKAEADEIELTLGLRVEAEPSEYRQFCEAVEEAVATAEAELAAVLMREARQGRSSAAAAETLLKRRFRERWGDRAAVEVSGGVAVSGTVDHIVQVEPWAPDAGFAARVIRILADAGKLPEAADPDALAPLVAAPLALPAGADPDDRPAVDAD